jgi:lysophospholipase L1-like esterase|nr:SGNH/GDSL hydrolase family protein [Allomuricauda sp.]|tara:strand:- start:9218 stop:9829 length:612 start_codon:yes stop_codon:yes gene_type:complete
MAQETPSSFLALGDSYTAATGELNKNSWPMQLHEIIDKKYIDLNEPHILAKAGWTTTDLLEAIATADLSPPYDQVALLIGVNNQYQGLPIRLFEVEFAQLLARSIELAGNDRSNVFVLTIPDWGATPFARFRDKEKITTEIGRYNRIIKNMAKEQGVLVVDITPSTRNMAVNPNLIASDSLHPSKKMYQSWAKKIAKKLRKRK